MGKAKLNIPMCAALILLLLTMISVHMTSGLYARYTSTATATDTARVAKFDVARSVEPVKDKNGVYELTITNNSEVSITYHVDLVFKESLKDALDSGKLSITLHGKTGSWDDSTNTLTFNKVETIKYNSEPVTRELVIEVQDWKFVTAAGEGASIEKTLDFTVNVTAEQVD